ncbi:DUF4136 domain-containing protein [Qipengyuania sp. 6B39]|nr:DUF4136 domain-containing protein [Qipengyuania proteolytica]
MKPLLPLAGLVATIALGGCATPPGPVEVTRFVAVDQTSRLGQGTIFIETMEGTDGDSLELAPYKAAVAAELTALGYVESDRASAGQIAQVGVGKYFREAGDRRGPVSVGVGGGTGGYRSGVGVGLGINLGGDKDRLGTELSVRITDAASGTSLWEGRADFSPPENSPLARGTANAQTVASALFREFPGNNGETIEVKVSE